MNDEYIINNKNYEYRNLECFSNRFDNIVSVQGFGWSGSTAVCDVLSEFKNWSTHYPKTENSGVIRDYSGYECQLFYLFGLLQLRDSCGLGISDDVFDLRFKQTLYKYYYLLAKDGPSCGFGDFHPIFKTKQFKVCLFSFLCKILELNEIELKIIDDNFEDYFFPVSFDNPSNFGSAFDYEKIIRTKGIYIKSYTYDGYIYYKRNNKIKTKGVLAFDPIFKEFLYNFFEVLSNGQRCLCISQLFNNKYIDDESCPSYLPDEFKHIYVYRDPRDVYFTNSRRFWNYSSLENTIRKYESCNLFGMYYSGKKRLLIRFENLVNDYEVQLSRILIFLNLSEEDHVNKFKFFYPEKSKRAIGIYKKYHDQNAMEEIKKRCFQFLSDEPVY